MSLHAFGEISPAIAAKAAHFCERNHLVDDHARGLTGIGNAHHWAFLCHEATLGRLRQSCLSEPPYARGGMFPAFRSAR